MSLYHARGAGDFAWPDRASPEFPWLTAWLTELTRLSMREAFNIACDAQRLAHKVLTFGEIEGTRLIEVVDSLGSIPGDDVVSLRTCLAKGDPRRVYAAVEDQTVYPLLWDPGHALLANRVSAWHGSGVECRRCLHP